MSARRSLRIFVSYSHFNRTWCTQLLPIFKVKGNLRKVNTFHDSEIKAGDRWDKQIRSELNDMDIFLCLVSMHFLASDYIRNVELKIAKERYRRGEIIIVPIILQRVNLAEDCPFLEQFQSLPAPDRPCEDFRRNGSFGRALFAIGEGLKTALQELEQRQQPAAAKARLRSS